MTDKHAGDAETIGGGFKAINYVMSIARQVGARKLSASVRSKNACKACAFGTGGQRGGLHNEHSKRIEICNKNIQAQLSDHRAPIPPQIFQQNSLAELRQLSGKQLEALGRLSHPLYKAPGADRYELIDYDRALQLAGRKMRATRPDRSFFYGSGRSSNEAAFLLQLFARVYGCNHINSCSYYCHQASGIGLSATVGTGTATIRYADLHAADTIFVFGANPASNHPRFVKVLLECRQRGGKVIVINPAREAGLVRFASPANFRSMIAGGGEVASHYVQPHVGGDVAFTVGVAKCLLDNNGADPLFIEQHTEGFEAYRDFVVQTQWQDIVRESGVDQETIVEISRIYQASQATVMAWGMGLTHHYNGAENIEAVIALALLRGMVGGPGKGLLPLRGHSNVQGVSTVGLTPAIKSQVMTALERELDIALPAGEGMDTLACVQAAAAGRIDFALLLGGNLYSANPDSRFSAQALDRIPFKVMLNSTLNETHLNGVEGENLILPVRVRDEEKQATTQESMFNFVRLSDGGLDRLPALRSEVDLIAGLAEQVISASTLKFSEFRKHRNIRQVIAKVIPGLEDLEHIDNSKAEFHIKGRHLETPRFRTASHKAHFCVPKTTSWHKRFVAGTRPSEFILTSVRSEGQFNTIIYSDEDSYRRQSDRRALFMHPDDLDRLGLEDGALVDVHNDTGIMPALRATRYDIRQGSVMTYFPEANVLIPQDTDPRSRTPGFKSVLVNVQPHQPEKSGSGESSVVD